MEACSYEHEAEQLCPNPLKSTSNQDPWFYNRVLISKRSEILTYIIGVLFVPWPIQCRSRPNRSSENIKAPPRRKA